MTLRNEEILENERKNTTLYWLENSLLKRLWTCRKMDCVVMNDDQIGDNYQH